MTVDGFARHSLTAVAKPLAVESGGGLTDYNLTLFTDAFSAMVFAAINPLVQAC